MRCFTIDECIKQIGDYCDGMATGFPMIVDVENYKDYVEILNRMEIDNAKTCIYISAECGNDVLPYAVNSFSKVKGKGTFVLIGATQAAMLQSEETVENILNELVVYPVSGHAIVLCDHCRRFLQMIGKKNLNFPRRMLLLDDETSTMPMIRLATDKLQCYEKKPVEGIKQLLSLLEKGNIVSSEITVITNYQTKIFEKSVFSVSISAGVYEILCKQYSDIASMSQQNYGTEAQWHWLASEVDKFGSFSGLVCEKFESPDKLIIKIADYLLFAEDNILWLYWLSLKVFCSTGSNYFAQVVYKSETYLDFERILYMYLLQEEHTNSWFSTHYAERRHLLSQLDENIPLIQEYCDNIARHGKNAIYYLTDNSKDEQFALIKCLSMYEYSEQEILNIFLEIAPELAKYLNRFEFNQSNTKIAQADNGIWKMLTNYFQEYKIQKITSRIHPEFVNKVQTLANERVYNKLLPRSSIVKKMEKDGVQAYFFDALGIEFLPYISTKCEEYGMICGIDVVHGMLPSITCKNKEFEQYFPIDSIRKIDALDDLKHHSQIYNYQAVKEPVHLFDELDIIDKCLRSISLELAQEHYDKAVILADHGASRLAVIYNQENDKIELEENGKHSGRCCPVDEDPQIPYAAYEDGYAILANYERFKGGRKANVEVHGGASLEEVVVPIIYLNRKQDELQIFFPEPIVKIKIKGVPSIVLFANPQLKQPRMLVNEIFYEGKFMEDKKNIQFFMPEIKRSNTYEAEIYDGDCKITTLSFRIEKKNAQERKLF